MDDADKKNNALLESFKKAGLLVMPENKPTTAYFDNDVYNELMRMSAGGGGKNKRQRKR